MPCAFSRKTFNYKIGLIFLFFLGILVCWINPNNGKLYTWLTQEFMLCSFCSTKSINYYFMALKKYYAFANHKMYKGQVEYTSPSTYTSQQLNDLMYAVSARVAAASYLYHSVRTLRTATCVDLDACTSFLQQIETSSL